MAKFEIKQESHKLFARFKTLARTLAFKLTPIPEGTDPSRRIKEAFEEILRYATEHLEPSDLVGFTFSSKDFSRGQGWIPFQEAEKVQVQQLFDLVGGLYQSNSAGLDTNTFELGVTSIRLPRGSGRSSKNFNTFTDECHKRQGIIEIMNLDSLCLPLGLVVAISKIKDTKTTFRKLYKNKSLQKEKALKLCEDAGVVVPSEGCGLEEVQKFQDFLKDFQIRVYEFGKKGRNVLFEGPKGTQNINLLFYENHFNVITSLTAAFGCGYYCQDCHVPYNTKGKHICKNSCSLCKQKGKCLREIRKQCSDCNRTFYSEKCFENHKLAGGYFGKEKTVCEIIKFCLTCRKGYKSPRKHVCGEIFCKICRKFEPNDHLCFIQKDSVIPKLDNTLYIFFDLETRQENRLDDGTFLHETNLCVFKTACTDCLNESTLEFSHKCGPNLEVLRVEPIKNFVSLILSTRKLFKSVIVLAHFGSGFDMQFILNHLLLQTDHTPEVILRGSKILLMTLCNVKFLDSINFMPMGLSKLPKAFGLGDSFKKGYFPHLFNKIEHENYVGPLLALEFYEPNSMMEDERHQFLKWYEANKHNEFNFQQELVDYCVSDVSILKEACLKFRELMLQTSGVCPFSESCTIPGACNKIFRRNFLRDKTIAIIPKNGYRLKDNQSKIALKWLVWEEEQRKINILHAVKQQEIELGGFKVDGFCRETNQVFEFYGCFWHGCPECYKLERDRPLKEAIDTFDSRYEWTLYRSEALKALGYEVIEKWECAFSKDMKEKPEIEAFLKNHPLLNFSPLQPREAFYGGRTGNCNTYYKAKDGEKIKYVDVCSLYPFVCKYGKFPVGHPQVFVGHEQCNQLDLKETDGIIKCKILPPQELYHPVLPQKMQNKLMFVLCRTCGEQMNKDDECNHNDEARALTGTWILDEVVKAQEKGYKIIEIYELWKYQVEQYNSVSREGGLFVEMMNQFIKIKQEASDWPSHCETEESKQKYIEEFNEKEGILLDKDKICKNPGLRSLAKLILNSFWGKFGQLEQQTKTKIVRDSQEYFETIMSPVLNINSIVPIDQDVMLINYSEIEEDYEQLKTVNVATAAYVTAQARLKLYSYLESLGERVLYYDTDSVIFSHKAGEYEPPTGEFVGDMTDELESYGSGSFIKEFASGGPKNYSYKIFIPDKEQEKTVCKVKGIRLNFNASHLVNFESMKNMTLSESEVQSISIISKNFRRTEKHEVVTVEETKRYKVNSTKRKFLDNFDSLPYGYKKVKLSTE